MKTSILSLIAISAISSYSFVYAMNMADLSNFVFQPRFHIDKKFELAALVERGFGSKAYDECCATNVLRMYYCKQDSLAMLLGFSPDSTIGKLNTLIDAVDDGVRGNFIANARLDLLYNASFAFRYRFNRDFHIGFYLPVRSMRLSNVAWFDQTQDVTAADLRVKEFLTDDFFANVQNLGCLNLCGWKRSGLGDFVILSEWQRDFPQAKPFLKNVELHARLGVSLPTGLKRNEDLALALPFGFDGAVGALWSGGLDLTMGEHFRAGLNVALTHIFGNSRDRRIKTDISQTDILLLQKTCAYKDWGLTQQFTLYFEFLNMYKGLSASVNYQFYKHGEDRLALETLAFSNNIANTNLALEDWTLHCAIFKLTYDMYYDMQCDARVRPMFSLFTQLPFNGKRAVGFQTVGASIAIDF